MKRNNNNGIKKGKKGLFIFRRDLRIEDNIGFQQIMSICDEVYSCFIFTPEQVGNQNKYKSVNSVQFMLESLLLLDKSLKAHHGRLYTFYGTNRQVVTNLIDSLAINVVGFNKDYSPYAVDRDRDIMGICDSRNVECLTWDDYYLYSLGTILTGSGEIYKKFTPFYQVVINKPVEKPRNVVGGWKLCSRPLQHLNHTITFEAATKKFVPTCNKDLIVHGGRENGLKQLSSTLTSQKHYEKTRNTLSINTSLLSPYLKFGCISIREVYDFFRKNFGKHSEIMRQLIWREFYGHVLYGYPEMVQWKGRKPNTKVPKWQNNMSWFEKWCQGKTGFPIVDACMRQLNATGWMHNRGRLIVSCFLVKTLLIDWRKGEEYFATKLVDYDIAMNNGNWQWISSTGVDSMPYFRIFNPWTQSQDYDSDSVFIKTWIPELESVDPDDLHHWNDTYTKYKINYPKPLVDFSIQRKRMLEMYK